MKQKLFSLFIVCLFTVALVIVPQASAQTQAWSGVCVDTVGGNTDVATIQGAQCLLANLLSVAISGIGLAGFVMMIVGSFKYLLSGGNSKGIEEAKGTMTMAIVGLVVALSAFIILNLLAAFTGTGTLFTQFVIPSSDTGL